MRPDVLLRPRHEHQDATREPWREPARRDYAALRTALGKAAPALVFCVVITAAWEAMARAMASPLIPDVSEIFAEIERIVVSGAAAEQIALTLSRILLGFIAAAAVALIAGIPAAKLPVVRRFLEPAIVLGLTIPGLVWALLCVIWFGISLWTPTVAIALGIAPALVLNVIQGIKSIDGEVSEMAHVFRLSTLTKFRYIWLPSLVPYLFSGARLGFSLAWKVIVLVELFGMSNGVGYQLNSEFSSQNVGGVLAWTIVFWVVMAAIEYGFIQGLEQRSMRWRRVTRV
jgi:NitT/TauT family transport system permease protein